MSRAANQRDLEDFCALGLQVLGQPIQPIVLDWDLRHVLREHAGQPLLGGPHRELVVRNWHTGRRGHSLAYGIEVYEVRTDRGKIPVLHLVNPQGHDSTSPFEDAWGVAHAHVAALFRFLRRQQSQLEAAPAPVLAAGQKELLFRNTVGFLRQEQDILKRFGIPLKRGVMLLGEPGNGKTMAARWLRSEAVRHGFEWQTVTPEAYECSRSRGAIHELFDLDQPGIVFLDDFEAGLRDRRETPSSTHDQATMLGELDGLTQKRGIVFIFTTNLKVTELDPAIRRPGRIDVFVEFQPPTPDLRRELIVTHWPAEMNRSLPVDDLVAKTEGLSFAELDELKRLLVFHWLETKRWDWQVAWSAYRARMGFSDKTRAIGFLPPQVASTASLTSVSARARSEG